MAGGAGGALSVNLRVGSEPSGRPVLRHILPCWECTGCKGVFEFHSRGTFRSVAARLRSVSSQGCHVHVSAPRHTPPIVHVCLHETLTLVEDLVSAVRVVQAADDPRALAPLATLLLRGQSAPRLARLANAIATAGRWATGSTGRQSIPPPRALLLVTVICPRPS